MRCLDRVTDNQQRQGADQSKKRRECRYKAYLFKGRRIACESRIKSLIALDVVLFATF